jgi:hypothetical protein
MHISQYNFLVQIKLKRWFKNKIVACTSTSAPKKYSSILDNNVSKKAVGLSVHYCYLKRQRFTENEKNIEVNRVLKLAKEIFKNTWLKNYSENFLHL